MLSTFTGDTCKARSTAVRAFWRKKQHAEKAPAPTPHEKYAGTSPADQIHPQHISGNLVWKQEARCSWIQGLLTWQNQRKFPCDINDPFCRELLLAHFNCAVESQRHILSEDTPKCPRLGTTWRIFYRRTCYAMYQLLCTSFCPCYNVGVFYRTKTK